MVDNLDYDRYIDVDFPSESRYVPGDLGDLCFASYTAYEDVVEPMTTAEINAEIERQMAEESGAHWLVHRIHDQDGEGQCTADAITGAHEIKQGEQYGLDNVISLSAASLYKRIGDSPDSGSVPSQGIKEMVSRGALPLDTPENRRLFGVRVFPNYGFHKPLPADWELTAALFTLDEWHAVKTPAGLMTALCKRDPVVVGRQGHAIAYCSPWLVNGNWAANYGNSWTTNWGFPMGVHKGGFGRDTMSQIKASAKYAFVLRSVRSPYLEAVVRNQVKEFQEKYRAGS